MHSSMFFFSEFLESPHFSSLAVFATVVLKFCCASSEGLSVGVQARRSNVATIVRSGHRHVATVARNLDAVVLNNVLLNNCVASSGVTIAIKFALSKGMSIEV